MATIRKLPSGKWQVLVRRKGHRPQTKSFFARLDAEKWSRTIESDLDRGVFLDRSTAETTTLGELIDRYLVEVTPGKKSAKQERQRLLYLKQHFGPLSAATLQSRHIAEWRDKRLKSGKAGSTVVKEINSLSHLIDTAIKDWGIGLSHNPAHLIRKPKQARGRCRRLDAVEEQYLLTASKTGRSPLLGPLLMFAVETGMRLGELLSLDWYGISIPSRTAILNETKNGEERLVPLSTRAIAILHSIPRHLTDCRVFWTWKQADSFEHVWKANLKRAKRLYVEDCISSNREPDQQFLADIRFHDLRHEAVSRLFEKDLNVMEVASISGHKTLQMLKRYTHLKADHLLAKIG